MENKICRKCQETKEKNDFPQNLSYKDGKATICKKCSAKGAYLFRTNNYEKYMATKYKTTPEEIVRLHSTYKVCMICHKTDRRKLGIDHCHETGKIRGLLCDNCNKGIGNLQDDIEILNNAIKYLRQYG